jgi:hypothetical protein
MGFTMAEKRKMAVEFAPRCRTAGKSEKHRFGCRTARPVYDAYNPPLNL